MAPRALKYPPNALLCSAVRVPCSVAMRNPCMTPKYLEDAFIRDFHCTFSLWPSSSTGEMFIDEVLLLLDTLTGASAAGSWVSRVAGSSGTATHNENGSRSEEGTNCLTRKSVFSTSASAEFSHRTEVTKYEYKVTPLLKSGPGNTSGAKSSDSSVCF